MYIWLDGGKNFYWSSRLQDRWSQNNADLRGTRDAPPLPGGPNSFNFMQFLEEFGKIVYWRPLESWRPHLREILDPPLQTVFHHHPTILEGHEKPFVTIQILKRIPKLNSQHDVIHSIKEWCGPVTVANTFCWKIVNNELQTCSGRSSLSQTYLQHIVIIESTQHPNMKTKPFNL